MGPACISLCAVLWLPLLFLNLKSARIILSFLPFLFSLFISHPTFRRQMLVAGTIAAQWWGSRGEGRGCVERGGAVHVCA